MSSPTPSPDQLRSAAAGPLAGRLSSRYLEEHSLLPLRLDEGARSVVVAAGRDVDPTVTDELARLFGYRVQVVAAEPNDIRAALLGARREAAEAAAPVIAPEDALGDLRAQANDAPVVQLVTSLLSDALRTGASDVHLESVDRGLRVRRRQDGVLGDVATFGADVRSGIVSRVKLLAGLDIAERRLPQDGRARIALGERQLDVRVSTLPALHGESVVIRLLDHGAGARNLRALGMPADLEARFGALVERASGLVLVTGPTGSGKTTTLYAALDRRNDAGVKIVTVEDPIEYQIPGVIQIPVNRKAGLGFANALRSILRHDPDVVMVGEMRDRETSEIAVQAALTGHLVFSTLHTNDAPGGVARLVDMGVEPYLVAATVQGILAQRLVRVVCPTCAAPIARGDARLARLAEAGGGTATGGSRRGAGCADCGGSGYRGRTGVYELWVPNDNERRQIARDARVAGRAQTTLVASGWALVQGGVTTPEEVLRVISVDDAS